MKGIGFANVHTFVLERYGNEGWQRVRHALPERDATELDGVIAVGWYDVLLFARLLRAVDGTFGRGDLQLLTRLGAYEAERDFNRVLRLLLRVVTPHQVFRAEKRLWSHFQDAGVWTTQTLQDGMRCGLSGWAVDAALCVELRGYLARLFEFTGGRNVRVDHPECRASRHPRCVFDVRWAPG
jgi:hypothetical protein